MGTLNFTAGQRHTFTKTFAESDVYLFAGIIGDFFPAHVNEEYCKTQFYKTRIVHGCLTFSLASTVSGQAGVESGHDIVAYGYDKLRFQKPVFFGDTITATYTFTDVDEAKRLTTADCVMTNQRGEQVLSCVHYMKVLK
jgi:acyl dehydratase